MSIKTKEFKIQKSELLSVRDDIRRSIQNASYIHLPRLEVMRNCIRALEEIYANWRKLRRNGHLKYVGTTTRPIKMLMFLQKQNSLLKTQGGAGLLRATFRSEEVIMITEFWGEMRAAKEHEVVLGDWPMIVRAYTEGPVSCMTDQCGVQTYNHPCVQILVCLQEGEIVARSLVWNGVNHRGEAVKCRSRIYSSSENAKASLKKSAIKMGIEKIDVDKVFYTLIRSESGTPDENFSKTERIFPYIDDMWQIENASWNTKESVVGNIRVSILHDKKVTEGLKALRDKLEKKAKRRQRAEAKKAKAEKAKAEKAKAEKAKAENENAQDLGKPETNAARVPKNIKEHSQENSHVHLH